MRPVAQSLAIIPTSQQDIAPLDFVAPGFKGLNTVESGMLIDPAYCVQASNAVIDINGRLAARYGLSPITSTPISGTPSIKTAFEANLGQALGFQTIVAWNGGVSNNPTNPNTGSLAGAGTYTNGRWFMQNFNNRVIAMQPGQSPLVYNPGSYAPFTAASNTAFQPITVSAGSIPLGGIGCAAFGRLWIVDTDLQTIKYCGLLDETDWSLTDGNAGLIDMHTIWSDGTDQVTAIFAFNASLVVCGTKHIIFFTDGRGSMLGMDPTQAYVFDQIAGTGCVSQFTVDKIGETDVVFLGPQGLQSLSRLTTARNNSTETLSKYNRDTLLAQITGETLANITGCYNNLTGFYVLGLPTAGLTWCFDMRRLYQDDVGAQCSITTIWTTALTAAYSSKQQAQGLFIARAGTGTLTQYLTTVFQDEGTNYTFTYLSPWMNLGQQVATRYKLIKRLELILYTSGNEQFTMSWTADFGTTANQVTQTIPTFPQVGQYGIGLYGVALYGTSLNASIYLYKYPAHMKAQYVQLGFSSPVSGILALQQAQFAAKIGRVA